MNHEFWNEIGNLYFMCGAYEPAIHAYLNSIKLDNTFGRSYSNLALVYVHTGRYREAIDLYLRGIELLADEKEKASTWNKLGLLYRQIKEYENALEAYQRADFIAPQSEEQVRAGADTPLAVLRPEIDLRAILAKGNLFPRQIRADIATEINAEFEAAEVFSEMHRLEEDSLPLEIEDYARPPDVVVEPIASRQSDWRLAYAPPVETPEAVEDAPMQESLGGTKPAAVVEAAPRQDQLVEDIPTAAMEAVEEIVESTTVDEPAPQESLFFETSIQMEPMEIVMTETNLDAAENPLLEQPLAGISAGEQKRLEMEVIKYQQATATMPQSYILWQELGEAYKAMGQYKNAIHAFQTAISLSPSNPMIYYRLGLMYAAERRTQEAIKTFQKVLEISPNLAQAHASLSSQYRKLGMEEAAKMHIEKARALQLDDESDYNRACLEALSGNNDAALDLLESALRAKLTYPTWVQNDSDFDSLRGNRRFQELLSMCATVEA